MGSSSRNPKTTSSNSEASRSAASAGSQGIAIAPPAYGIESVDRALTQTTPESGLPIQRMEAESAGGGDAGSGPPNRTGLPDSLKSGVESLSGLSLDDVRVHYNSPKPMNLNALAYTQGTDIHVAPRQERHLPHEAWHVVQQKQGRVKPTLQMKSVQINDDANLEKEADNMGAKAARQRSAWKSAYPVSKDKRPAFADVAQQKPVIQRLMGVEVELNIPFYGDGPIGAENDDRFPTSKPNNAKLIDTDKRDMTDFLWGGLNYGTSYGKVKGYFDISADHSGFQSIHRKFANYLVTKGYILMPSGYKFITMTNMEYRSKAFEERDPASQAKINKVADDIKDHAVDSATKAQSGDARVLNAPVEKYYTGLPKAAFKTMLEGDPDGLLLLDQLDLTIDPTLYFQTTTGTLPSEIPSLFAEAASNIHAKNPKNIKGDYLNYCISEVENVLKQEENVTFLSGFSTGEVAALKGWMTLVTQYLFAYQLETSSYRYRIDPTDKKLKGSGSTAKNLVPYLSKTHLVDSIAALPPSVRPNILSGTKQADWKALFDSLRTHIEAFNIVAKLKLVDHDGKNFYNSSGKNPQPVEHGDVFGAGKTPEEWIKDLLEQSTFIHKSKTYYTAFHVMTGNELDLDAGQENENPPLTIKGEQAIPLEDRYTQSKKSFGNPKAIDKADVLIKAEWQKAVDRRLASTKGRSDFITEYNRIAQFFTSYGLAADRVTSLKALNIRFGNIQIDPDDVAAEREKLDNLAQEILEWTNNYQNSLAGFILDLLRPVIQNTKWNTKANAFIGRQAPAGVAAMRTELGQRRTDSVKLNNLVKTAKERLAKHTSASQVTTNFYTLLRDLAPPGLPWDVFITRLDAVENLL